MVKGKCPSGFEDVANDCPEWDKSCGCHGPVMQKGYVGWAAGATGPDVRVCLVSVFPNSFVSIFALT